MSLAASSTSSIPSLHVSAAKSRRPQAPSCLLPLYRSSWITSSFKSGFPLVVRLASRKFKCRSARVPIKCDQGAKETGGLDVWLGRLAMVGCAATITVEIVTGKGLLENFGLVAPLPSFALILTTLVGILAAVFIFQSATLE